MTRAKPNRRWVARRTLGVLLPKAWRCVLAPTWFLARQRAAVLLRADPDEIDVRPG